MDEPLTPPSGNVDKAVIYSSTTSLNKKQNTCQVKCIYEAVLTKQIHHEDIRDTKMRQTEQITRYKA